MTDEADNGVFLVEGGKDALLAFYTMWKEEMLYRRHRTSFITSWYTGLFVAFIGGLLAGGQQLTPTQAWMAFALIVIVWSVTVGYFRYNINNHRFAKELLKGCQGAMSVNGKSLLCLEEELKRQAG